LGGGPVGFPLAIAAPGGGKLPLLPLLDGIEEHPASIIVIAPSETNTMLGSLFSSYCTFQLS